MSILIIFYSCISCIILHGWYIGPMYCMYDVPAGYQSDDSDYQKDSLVYNSSEPNTSRKFEKKKIEEANNKVEELRSFS